MRSVLGILVSILMISFSSATAQERLIEISGKIIDAETQDPVPYVHILNPALQKGTTSNTEGRFWITMRKADTLLFSAIGFEKFAFTLKEQVNSDRLEVTIALNTSTMELKPIKVFAYKDEQALKKAILEMDVPLEEKEQFSAMPRSQPHYTLPTGGISIGGPLSALAKNFSREEKEKKRLQKFKAEYDYTQMIRAKYNESIVMELTGLPEDKVEEFMEFCKLEESFVGASSEYEIAVAVNKCLSEFRITGK